METARTTHSAPPPSRQGPNARAAGGFTLVEIAIVLGVLALLLALTIPRYKTFITTQRLRGSTENIAAQIRIIRERAMATGVDQPIHFFENTYNADLHVHVGGVVSANSWNFPPGVRFYPIGVAGVPGDTLRMKKDGTASPARKVILVDGSGRRDTLSVLSSGIVLIR